MKNINNIYTITILTIPINESRKEKIINFFRPFLPKKYKRMPNLGHFAVTRSILDGFSRNGFPFYFNPKNVRSVTKILWAVAGINTLEYAIGLKKKGIINTLVCGPNIMVRPKDNPNIDYSYIDIFIQPSNWCKNIYIDDIPLLQKKIVIWPAGVDTLYWKPSRKFKQESEILIFLKKVDESILHCYFDYFSKRSLKYKVIQYGLYTQEEYKRMLDESHLMIYFSHSESEGIALLEAWSMGVPTFVWNPGYCQLNGISVQCDSAPYLTPFTGTKFFDFTDFKAKFEEIEPGFIGNSNPREWTVRNLDDIPTSKKIYTEIIKFEQSKVKDS